MNQAVLTLSDICIQATEAGTELYAEPGIALLMAGEQPVLGTAAQQAIRQQPTRIASRYWSDLSTDSIQLNNSNIRHNADLVWHQLSQIKSTLGSNKVSLCVPSNLSQPQLELLTGICQSLELHIHSLVNLGLAQLVGNQADGEQICGVATQIVTHLDLQLHQLVISNYQVANNRLELKSQETIQDISFLRLIDLMLHMLRDKFIQSSRFDPLHSGDTEQQLFNQLIQLINTKTLHTFQVDTAQKQHRIDISAQELSGLISRFKQELKQRITSSGCIAYAPVFSQLPGFQLNDNDIGLCVSDTQAGASILASKASPDGELIYIKHASLSAESLSADESVQEQPATSVRTANAVVFDGLVYQQGSYERLISAGFPEQTIEFIDDELRAMSKHLWVNGVQAAVGQPLAAGDRLKTKTALELIAVCMADA